MHINKKWLAKKAERRKLAEARTGWNQISIHDRAGSIKRLVAMHAAVNARNKKLGRPLLDAHDLTMAAQRVDDKYWNFRGDRSKYTPHQGDKEKLRRRNRAATAAA